MTHIYDVRALDCWKPNIGKAIVFTPMASEEEGKEPYRLLGVDSRNIILESMDGERRNFSLMLIFNASVFDSEQELMRYRLINKV